MAPSTAHCPSAPTNNTSTALRQLPRRQQQPATTCHQGSKLVAAQPPAVSLCHLCYELTRIAFVGARMWGNGLSWAEPDYKEGKPGNKIATGAAVVPGREVLTPTRSH